MADKCPRCGFTAFVVKCSKCGDTRCNSTTSGGCATKGEGATEGANWACKGCGAKGTYQRYYPNR